MKHVVRIALVLLTPLVLLTASSAIRAAEPAPKNQPITFQALVMVEPATSISLTEDGRHLIVTHQAANLVSVYDAGSLELVTSLETPAPRIALCRGDGIYVSNFGHGTISYFSAKQNWELINQYDVGMPNVAHVSAAQGKHFDEQFLVSCHGDGRSGSYQGAVTFLLDARKDRVTRVGQKSLASLSYDGKLALCQSSFNLSPSGQIEAFAPADLAKERPEPIFRGGVMQTPYLYQTHPGSYWIGNDIIFAGAPIAPLKEKIGDLLIPDLADRLVYSLADGRLNALKLDSALTEIGSRKVSFPEETAEKMDGLTETRRRRREYLLDHPIGWTEGDLLRLFVLDMNRNVVLTATTPAFLETRAKLIRPDSGATAEMPASPERPASGASAEDVPVLGKLGIPTRHVAGQMLNVQLKGPAAASYHLLTGPPGMTLTATGALSSPARDIDGRTYVQTSATVNPGNSGGPLFDSHGHVIGLIVLKARIDGVAFAVPATELRNFLQKATANSN